MTRSEIWSQSVSCRPGIALHRGRAVSWTPIHARHYHAAAEHHFRAAAVTSHESTRLPLMCCQEFRGETVLGKRSLSQ